MGISHPFPAQVKDLARVSADTAAHVLIMMSEQDEIEEAETRGKISNGASLRTLLALRHVLFTSANHSPTRSVVVQILKPSIQIEAASFRDARGYPLVKPLDMGVFLNSLLFSCASQQGLSLVLMELLDCEGAAFQRRRATLFCGGVVGLTVAAADDLLDRGSIIAVSSSLPGAKPELCPPPDTVIKAEDVVIFVAETSTPKATPRDAAFVSTRAEAARRLKATQDETRSRLRRTSSAVLRGARYILVCGWRPVWTDEAHRLRDRVYQLLDGATPGSQIIFANGLPELTFRELMTGACGFRDVSGVDDAVFETALGVRIRHAFRCPRSRQSIRWHSVEQYCVVPQGQLSLAFSEQMEQVRRSFNAFALAFFTSYSSCFFCHSFGSPGLSILESSGTRRRGRGTTLRTRGGRDDERGVGGGDS